MIPQRYIKRFLNRPLRDYRKCKTMTEQQLTKAVDRLPIHPTRWKKLTRDQKITVLIACLRPRFAVFSDPGAGKTMIALSVSDYLEQLDKVKRVLVLVPRRANKSEWALQIEEHTPELDYIVLRGSSADKWTQLRESQSLFVMETYAGLTRLVCDSGPRGLVLNLDLLDRLLSHCDGFILDESSFAGGGASLTKQSLIFQILVYLTRDAKLVLPMSGTPFGRDPSLLWAQMYLVDRGETLGKSLGLFRAAFFGEKDYWGRQDFLESKGKALHRLLANNSIRFEVDEAELPRRRPIKRYFSIPLEQQDWLERFYDILQNDPDRQKKESAFLRIRQLSSGFVGFTDDETGEKAQVMFAENPKLEALCDMALSIPPHYQFIVFHEWIVSGEWIAREFTKIGISHLLLRGRTHDPEKVLRDFKRGEKQAIIINHKSGDFGLNLQHGRYLFFYESPVSVIARTQCERRVIRRYSDNEWAAIIDLLMRGTLDDRVLKFHAEGKDLREEILDGREAAR